MPETGIVRELMAVKTVGTKEIVSDMEAGLADEAHQDGNGHHVA